MCMHHRKHAIYNICEVSPGSETFRILKVIKMKSFLFYKENTQRSPWLVTTKSILRKFTLDIISAIFICYE